MLKLSAWVGTTFLYEDFGIFAIELTYTPQGTLKYPTPQKKVKIFIYYLILIKFLNFVWSMRLLMSIHESFFIDNYSYLGLIGMRIFYCILIWFASKLWSVKNSCRGKSLSLLLGMKRTEVDWIFAKSHAAVVG